MLDCLHNDDLWLDVYETFVLPVSFADTGEIITFAEAFAAERCLVASGYNS